MIFAFFFKSLFCLHQFNLRLHLGIFFPVVYVLLQIARKLGHWIEVRQTFCGAIMLCVRESPKSIMAISPYGLIL